MTTSMFTRCQTNCFKAHFCFFQDSGGTAGSIKCSTCSKAYANEKELSKHVQQCRKIKKAPYQEIETEERCKLCSKKCSTEEDLKDHMRACSFIRPFGCNICKLGFINANKLRKHKDEDSCKNTQGKNNLNVCSECKQPFQTFQLLQIHISLKHSNTSQKGNMKQGDKKTGKTVMKNVTCDRCKKIFSSKSHLEYHWIRVHSTKPKECDICHKRITTKASYHKAKCKCF